MSANPYARGEHLKILAGYIERVKNLAGQVKTIEDYQLYSVDMIDCCNAALKLLESML
jgi:hypothetical protein